MLSLLAAPETALLNVESAVLRGLLALPRPAIRRLAGAPVDVDGQRLSPEVQLMLRVRELVNEPKVEELPVPEARIRLVHQSAVVGGRIRVGSTRDLVVGGATGPLPARLYRPTSLRGRGPAPTLMFFHGGGMMYGDLESHDAACRFLAEQSGVQVLAVDYRLAPEHPYPAGVDDAAAAYRWLVAHADRVGADPERLAVGGDSAGGYLAATTAVAAAEEGLPLAFQLLVYPVTDFVERSPSRRLFAEGFYLTARFMDGAEAAYFTAGADRSEPDASVLRRTEFPAGLAPAYVVTAGFDPLRDEGEAYARLLADHGVPVERLLAEDMIHGFFNMVGVGRDAPAYVRQIAGRLRDALA